MQENGKRNNLAVLYVIVYATMLIFGLVENIKGVSYPMIKAEFGVNYAEQGGLVSLTWMGYVAFCLAAGFFQSRFGIKKSLLAGYLLICLGAVATLLAPTFWMAAATLVIVNAGFGFFEVSSNSLGSAIFGKRAALSMNLMHFFYGFGAIAAPKAAGLLLSGLNFTWRQVYLAVIIPVAAMFLFVLFTRFKKVERAGDGGEAKPGLTFQRALMHPLVWGFALALGLMEVIEFGAANWGGLYLRDVYGLDPAVAGASFVSLFYILFTLSRLLSGLAIEKAGYERSLLAATGLTAAVFLAGFLLGRGGIWLLPVTGLFIGLMFPTMIAVAMKAFGRDAPQATGAIITLAGLVNGICQYAIGRTSQFFGNPWGYRSCLLYALLAMAAFFLLTARIKKRPYKALAG